MNELKTPVLWSGIISVWQDGEKAFPHLSESQPQWVELPDPCPPVELVPAGTTEKLMTALDDYQRIAKKLARDEGAFSESIGVMALDIHRVRCATLLAALRGGEGEVKHE